jgi:hypothetical protein
MNFITIISILLLISFQFSSLVLGDKAQNVFGGFGLELTQESKKTTYTSTTPQKTTSRLYNNVYVLFGKRNSVFDIAKEIQNLFSSTSNSEIPSKIPIRNQARLCNYCGQKKRDLKNYIFRK